jgi:hypothetical protein
VDAEAAGALLSRDRSREALYLDHGDVPCQTTQRRAPASQRRAPASQRRAPASQRRAPVSQQNPIGKMAWQNYGLAMLLLGAVPLLPLVIELIIHKAITEDSLAITAAVYSITVAIASNNKFYFMLFFIASVVEAALYGSITNTPVSANLSTWKLGRIPITSYSPSQNSDNGIFLIAMLLTFVSLLIERYSRHVTNREEFFEFLKGKRGG